MAIAMLWSVVDIAVPVAHTLVPVVGTPAVGPVGRTVGDKRLVADTLAFVADIRKPVKADTTGPETGLGTARSVGTQDERRTRRRPAVVGKRCPRQMERLVPVPVSGRAVPFPVVSLAVGLCT